MILTIIAFVFILSVLVIAHELGHFLAAKKSGVLVEEFAIGFPPRIWSTKKGETRYSINAIPIGGYVKMLGELEKSDNPRAFENQSGWKRFVISISGVVMNLILAWVLLTIGFSVGMAPIVSNYKSIPGTIYNDKVLVADVEKDSPAKEIGLEQMDVIISAEIKGDKRDFNSVSELSEFTRDHLGQKIKLVYDREGEVFSGEATLSTDEKQPLGVAILDQAEVRVAWYRAPYVALRETYKITEVTAVFVKNFFVQLFSSGKVSDEVGGPIAIYAYTGVAVKVGLMAILQFMAILSVNLAIVNILPFPALDGGRIIFIMIEGITRKKIIKEKVEGAVHAIGFLLLILLILLISYRDILRLFNK